MSGHDNGVVQSSVELYIQAKKELEKILQADGDGDEVASNIFLEMAEQNVDATFANLLEFRPNNLSEALQKARFYIDEILSEVEMTQYHKKALQNIVEVLEGIASQ